MSSTSALPWLVLALYGALIWAISPKHVDADQFFSGRDRRGKEPGFWLLVASGAISWIFAKSIANAASLAQAFGIWGGIGYAAYYLSFAVVGIAIYLIRTRGGWGSLSGFLVAKYGPLCAKLFLGTIAIRLFNEIWSNTKVTALFFGAEGSGPYWLAVFGVSAFTLYYSWRGGLRASLLTDGAQMILGAVLLVIVLALVGPGLARSGLPPIAPAATNAGMTFFALALVQAFSYGFHDPIMTDRAFITQPGKMLRAFIVAGIVSGGFIFLFSLVGLYARARGLEGNPVIAIAGLLGPVMMVLFNAIMLTSAGSTIDSAFASTAKLGARDWANDYAAITPRHGDRGRRLMVIIAIVGNLPLLALYLGDKVGPAIIAATTISGTMVMGLAPIFLLSWVRSARRLSFHMAFWPGVILGVLRTVEAASGRSILPQAMALGSGKYALDLGVNAYGLLLCSGGFLLGAWISQRAELRQKLTA